LKLKKTPLHLPVKEVQLSEVTKEDHSTVKEMRKHRLLFFGINHPNTRKTLNDVRSSMPMQSIDYYEKTHSD